MKNIPFKIPTVTKTAAVKLSVAAFIGAAMLTLAVAGSTGTSHAETATPPAPTPTVAPMTVGQPMMLQDAAGNTIMIMQGSTFYIFPRQPQPQNRKPAAGERSGSRRNTADARREADDRAAGEQAV